ncbi:MAG: phosphate ABC transporter ATP-binding protein PstB [Coriobacteriia bacterium]|nr:phosphate ABC transporter ATP-binding protein PstB [Coriobacteriia bacterium]
MSEKLAEHLAGAPSGSSQPDKFAVRKLEFYYGDFHALTDITVGIQRHAVTAFIGPSGCGKSTFLRTLNRMNDLIPGTRVEGSVMLDRQDVYAAGIDPVDLRRRVGMIFQQPNPFPMSIYENVAYGPKLHGVKKKADLDEVVEKSLQRANLWKEVKDILGRGGLTLSGGQQQRLCIARVLAVEPEVLLMDEPCSAIDPTSVQKVEDLMAELKDRITIVIVTHNMQQAARVSDYTAFFLQEKVNEAAELIEFDRTATLFTSPKDRRTEDYITGRFG